MSERSDELYIRDILEAIKDIESFIRGLTFKTFAHDAKTVHAVVRCMEIIGEAASHVSEEYRERHPSISWKHMVGMRNKMIHEYFGIDMDILWKTVTEDLLILKQAL